MHKKQFSITYFEFITVKKRIFLDNFVSSEVKITYTKIKRKSLRSKQMKFFQF